MGEFPEAKCINFTAICTEHYILCPRSFIIRVTYCRRFASFIELPFILKIGAVAGV